MSILLLLIALAGAGIALARAVQTGRLAVDASAFAGVIQRCLEKGDVERARKISAVIPEAPLGAATTAMLAGGAENGRAAFEEAFDRTAKPLVLYRFADALAWLLALAPAAYTIFVTPLSLPVLVTSGIAALLLLWGARTSSQTLASKGIVLERLLPLAALGSVHAYRSVATIPAATDAALAFTVARSGAPDRVVPLDQPIVKIGRDARSHLWLDDPSVARMHAVVERDDSGATIIDLGDEHGTSVNGRKVAKAKLAHGDTISIGPFIITVAIGGENRAPVSAETSIFYGFEARSPDLFHALIEPLAAGKARVSKLRREGSPRYVVALTGEAAAIESVRHAIERIDYSRLTTSAAEIAPDALYGPETATHAKLCGEIAEHRIDVIATSR